MLRRALAAHAIFPLAERQQGRRILAKLRALEAEAREPLPTRRARHRARLAAMAEHAGATVPYYRDLYRSRGFDPARLARDPAWLAELPLLDRETVAEQGERLLSERFGPTQRIHRRTGGSTGRALDVYYDPEALDWTAAVSLHVRARAGCPLGALHAHLPMGSGAGRPLRLRLEQAARCAANRRSYFFVKDLEPTTLGAIVRWLQRTRPRLVYTFPSVAFALARQVEAEGGLARPLFDVFESTGETLDEARREPIERTLGCRVAERYGSAEFGVVASSPEVARGFEILDVAVWPESIADEHGDPELVFTSLLSHAMPLLRYRSGDLGKIEADEATVCGRIPAIAGRRHDAVEIGGRTLATTWFQEVFRRMGCVDEFQIELRDGQRPLLRIVLADDEARERVAAVVREAVGDGAEIAWVGFDGLRRTGRRAKFSQLVRESASTEPAS